ncbi:MAG TPA: SDR family oxidoreductase [Burkholderiales bacterium]|nr:SDR family oxidoreductase [Burkholderiales bacterium]
MKLSATGLRVLVTAGAAGIGRAIAQTFVDNGARVHVCDIDEGALARLPDRMTRTKADVASLSEVNRLFDDVQRYLGGLDVLVNNAGVAGPTAKVEDIRPEDWDRCIAVDLNGMFYCTRKAMPLLKRSGGGSIVNLSSAAGLHGFPQRSPYCAAKWGVVGFTKSLSVEAGPDKVRVNCICPGIVEGERIDRVVDAKARSLGMSRESFLEKFLETTSMRSTVSAQEIANMALFLASDEGKHITGQALAVDAGVRYLV